MPDFVNGTSDTGKTVRVPFVEQPLGYTEARHESQIREGTLTWLGTFPVMGDDGTRNVAPKTLQVGEGATPRAMIRTARRWLEIKARLEAGGRRVEPKVSTP